MNVSVKGPNAAFAALPLSGRSGLAETRGYSRRTDRKAERRALRARRRTLASDVHHRDNALSSSNVRGRGTQREMRIRQAAVLVVSIHDGRMGRPSTQGDRALDLPTKPGWRRVGKGGGGTCRN